MSLTTDDRRGVTVHPRDALTVGVALVLAELLLATLWYPWVIEHLVLGSRLPFGLLRVLIVLPEFLLLAVGVFLIGLSRGRRVAAVALALGAGLVAWGVSVVLSHLVHTPADAVMHHRLGTFLGYVSLLTVPTLASLAWGVARRGGWWWLLAVPLAPALRWWIERTDWVFRVTLNHGFRAIEAYGMALAILPVLLAILAGWALEQLERARTEAV